MYGYFNCVQDRRNQLEARQFLSCVLCLLTFIVRHTQNAQPHKAVQAELVLTSTGCIRANVGAALETSRFFFNQSESPPAKMVGKKLLNFCKEHQCGDMELTSVTLPETNIAPENQW